MAGYEVKESKTIQTYNDPATIDAVNQKYETFMWNVLNVQITHVKDSHLEFEERQVGIINDRTETVVKSVTEETQYATITYERNKLIPHYEEVIAIEQEFIQIENQISEVTQERNRYARTNVRSWIKALLAICGVVMFLALFTYAGPADPMFKAGLAGFVVSAILGGGIFVRDQRYNNKMYEKFNAKLNKKLMPKRNEIMEEMQRLGRSIIVEMRARA